MVIILYVLSSLVLMNLTWVWFTAIMRLQEMRNSVLLTTQNKVLWGVAWLNLILGLLCDTLLNWVICTVLFFELPREFLTTARLCRLYETSPSSWRGKLAAWFGVILLNPVDPSGKHVK